MDSTLAPIEGGHARRGDIDYPFIQSWAIASARLSI